MHLFSGIHKRFYSGLWGISYVILIILTLGSCGIQRKISREADRLFHSDTLFRNAHIGISIYDPSEKKFLYRYQSDKYFVPASNTKILSCYAGMKYLGSTLKGIRYLDDDTAIFLLPTGDPTFLHPDYPGHPVADFLRNINKPVYITDQYWKSKPLGYGWSWDDYNEYYMPERNAMPVYGNIIRWYQSVSKKESPQFPGDTLDSFIYSDPEVDWTVDFGAKNSKGAFTVERQRDENNYTVFESIQKSATADVPFVTHGIKTAVALLGDTIHRQIRIMEGPLRLTATGKQNLVSIYSQPADSMLSPMMKRSDNFFAEQTLLMVADSLTGEMDEQAAIDLLLQKDFRDFPQQPRWVDGSGLSRYNLISPDDFVWLLDKMKNEFPFERIQGLFPAAGEGTLRAYTRSEQSKLYAKTGSLSGVMALSGYLIPASGKTYIFSILINNHRSSPAALRKQIDAFLQKLSQTN